MNYDILYLEVVDCLSEVDVPFCVRVLAISLARCASLELPNHFVS